VGVLRTAHVGGHVGPSANAARMLGATDNTTLNLIFTQGVYRASGASYSLANLPGWSFTRASTGTATNSAGTILSFASGQPRITDLGLLVEESRTNLLLQSRRTFD
jgi:hypothetical protein